MFNICCFSFKIGHELNRLVKWINSNPKAIVEKLRNNPCQQRTADFETWVSVGFNEVYFEIFIYHEVVSKYFKAVLYSVWINLSPDRSEGISDKSFHLREEISHEMNITRWVIYI